MPRYGDINHELIGSWFQREEPGGPMWALNLMQYRDRADYADGRATELTGIEADDVYAPHDHLAAVGSRIILIAPVVHQLAGDDRRWDHVAIAQYRDRMAMVEMSSSADFAASEAHKGAETAAELAAGDFDQDPSRYVVIVDPTMDEVARSLSNPSKVLL